MSDPIRHECGIAVVRLRKSLDHYLRAHGSAMWGFQKLYALMAKQRNRGQDGVGIGCCKLHMPLGLPYMSRLRSVKKDSLDDMFEEARKDYARQARREGFDPDKPHNIREHFEFGGEILIGHLRYGTSGGLGKGSCHPYIRRSNWPTKSLMVMGNFNMTNTDQLHQLMIDRGQHPVYDTDTQTVLEEVGFHLDELHTDIFRALRDLGVAGSEIPGHISDALEITELVRRSAEMWDGGYAIVGVVGNGDMFVIRDPNGIRPCYYYMDDDVIVFASERVAIQTVFDAEEDQVHELPRAHVAGIKADAREMRIEPFAEQRTYHPCSFERIYFSRGNDADIYRERKALGEALVPQFVQATEANLEHTVISFIPNTAETAYHGLMDGLRIRRRGEVREALEAMWQSGKMNPDLLDDLILKNWPRAEKIAHKDIKMRTFISQESDRDTMASSVYDITYGVVTPEDTLVVVDDSIVRGTTLRRSLLRILARTNPKRIVVLSTAPQIRYPDCYGIDMAELGKFIAFEAAIELIKERGDWHLVEDTRQKAQEQLAKSDPREMVNAVKDIYAPFTDDEISERISPLVTPRTLGWKGEVRVIYQTITGLHQALGQACGDWYFSGNYPTPGGVQMVNRAFVHYCARKTGRAYDLL